MATFKYKGKVTCLSRIDGSTVASWFKDLTIEAPSLADAQAQLDTRLRAEFEDEGIRITYEMNLQAPAGDPLAQAADRLVGLASGVGTSSATETASVVPPPRSTLFGGSSGQNNIRDEFSGQQQAPPSPLPPASDPFRFRI